MNLKKCTECYERAQPLDKVFWFAIFKVDLEVLRLYLKIIMLKIKKQSKVKIEKLIGSVIGGFLLHLILKHLILKYLVDKRYLTEDSAKSLEILAGAGIAGIIAVKKQ